MSSKPHWLRSALDDGTGQVSCTRLTVVVVIFVAVIMPALLWFWLSCLEAKLLEIPGTFTGFMGAAVATVCGLFALNKRSEG